MDPTFEPNLSRAKLDLSHIPESLLVTKHFTIEPKLTTQSNHIPLLDLGIDHYDSEMIFQDWSYNLDEFHVRIWHSPNQIGDNNNVNRKEIKVGSTNHHII